mmetsp:Transcript_15456/g.22045  ORF Transcript_15456/g.22045 Transcript_15456/m.22045 type:complete len:1076 (-) Transcript_15456:118-3345(-)
MNSTSITNSVRLMCPMFLLFPSFIVLCQVLNRCSSLSFGRTRTHNAFERHFHSYRLKTQINPKSFDNGFHIQHKRHSHPLPSLSFSTSTRTSTRTSTSASATSSNKNMEKESTLEVTSSSSSSFLNSLLDIIHSTSTEHKQAETSTGAHDAFRYEWGTWIDDERMETLMMEVDRIRLLSFDDLAHLKSVLLSNTDLNSDLDIETETNSHGTSSYSSSTCVASGKNWDIWIHLVTNGRTIARRWPTGSWSLLKCLMGVMEFSALRMDRSAANNGQQREDPQSTTTTTTTTTDHDDSILLHYKKTGTKKTLRGGSYGNAILGTTSTTSAKKNPPPHRLDGQNDNDKYIPGDDCIKYVGGPLRGYEGLGGTNVLFEIVIRPPTGTSSSISPTSLKNKNIEQILGLYTPPPPPPPPPIKDETPQTKSHHHNTTQDTSSIQQTNNNNTPTTLSEKMGITFQNVGGLDNQLQSIVRRVLSTRSNPKLAQRLGINHVRGILLSGPPGCGKTLLARELSTLLGAREPQIVNGPEILDKFVGEAERRVRDLFAPAEREYKAVGEDSALHVIILDELDAIAKKRGGSSTVGDSTGVRDSVVNQLLAKMDGVKEANNVLVVGMTNRPELLDPALLRPGRLEVHLRVDLPDLVGRRNILTIHTRQMIDEGLLDEDALHKIQDLGERGLPAQTEHYTGAELAGLVRSAASFSLARSMTLEDEEEMETHNDHDSQQPLSVSVQDLEQALNEVRPALGKQDELLQMRYPHGIVPYSKSMERIMRDLKRFVLTTSITKPAPVPATMSSSNTQSLLLVNTQGGGNGATALSAWAAHEASTHGSAQYVRFLTSLDILSNAGAGEEGRANELVNRFNEAKDVLSTSLLVLDDVDQLCAGNGSHGYSTIMIATLKALLRSPPGTGANANGNGNGAIGDEGLGVNNRSRAQEKGILHAQRRTMRVIATTSRSDAACLILRDLFDETIVIPPLTQQTEVSTLLTNSMPPKVIDDVDAMSSTLIDRLDGNVGCKKALRLVERAVTTSYLSNDTLTKSDNGSDDDTVDSQKKSQVDILEEILDDLAMDEELANALCNVF